MARNRRPAMIASLGTDVEVDAAVKAVVNARVPGGVRALVAGLGSDDQQAISDSYANLFYLEDNLGEPFERLAEEAGIAEARRKRYRKGFESLMASR
jgi:hypothetical protein